jgi:hypothetical protein
MSFWEGIAGWSRLSSLEEQKQRTYSDLQHGVMFRDVVQTAGRAYHSPSHGASPQP